MRDFEIARAHMNRLFKFLAAGGAGFAVDFTTFWAMLKFAHLPPLPARLIAFAIAVVFTYVFNRAFTFADRPRRGRVEWATYFAASAVAAVVNIGVFTVALKFLGAWPLAPYAAMPIGVAAGLVVNFVCYNFIVFRAEL